MLDRAGCRSLPSVECGGRIVCNAESEKPFRKAPTTKSADGPRSAACPRIVSDPRDARGEFLSGVWGRSIRLPCAAFRTDRLQRRLLRLRRRNRGFRAGASHAETSSALGVPESGSPSTYGMSSVSGTTSAYLAWISKRFTAWLTGERSKHASSTTATA